MKKIQLIIKRLFDLVVSMIGLVALAPAFIVVSVMIKITMPGKIFFKQERVGKDKRTFSVLKFRTMKEDKIAEATHDFSKDEERKTAFGNILRRTKIDETPQLINVLLGDMSLIGPRPTVMEQVEKYDNFQMQRLEMRPGMTGLAQVNGNIALSWEERIKYDVYYVRHFSVWWDIRILMKTVLVVIFGEEKFERKLKI